VPDDVATDFCKIAESYGKCEVILYSPEHTITLPELPVPHIRKLVDLWTERYIEMAKDEKIKYVFIFENRGEVVGVTMPHPHGQIYGYSFIPKRVELELDSCKEHFDRKGTCLICDMTEEEKSTETRIIMENEHFVVYLPFFSEYPYGTYVVSKAHKQNLEQFTDAEKDSLAQILRDITGTYDSLFDKQFPYMMCMYQAPVNSEDTSDYYHFRITFFPPMRDANKQKFNASSETAMWTHCNTTTPESKAEEMRQAFEKFKNDK